MCAFRNTHTHTHTFLPLQNLKPASGRRLMSAGSYETPPHTPPPNTSRGKSPVRNHSPVSPGRYSPSANGQGHSQGPDLPLPPVHSPNGSMIQALPSGPYLDPPSEFAASVGVSSPTSSTIAQNGGIPQQRVGVSQVQRRSTGNDPQVVPHGSPNSNGNNNNRGRIGSHSISLGMVNRVMVGTEQDHVAPPVQRQNYFPSQASTLSRSDIPETRSSMESGFDADNELENQQQGAWYISPDASPKSRRRSRESRPTLGPEVSLPLSQPVMRHTRMSSDSRDSRHSGSQMSQHESASDDYEKLVFNQPHPGHAHQRRAPRRADQRRGSLDAVVLMSVKDKSNTYTYGEQNVYDTAYPPVHIPSRSFDTTGHVSSRSGSRTRPTPPSLHHSQSSHHSQESHHTPRPPISPIPPANPPSSRATSAKSRSEKRSHHHHARNHSQPVHAFNSVPPPSHHHVSAHVHSQPDPRLSQSPDHTPQKRDRNQSHMRNKDRPFQSAYPGHKGMHYVESIGSRHSEPARSTGHPNHIHDPRGYNVHQSGRARHHSDMHSRVVEDVPVQHPRCHSDRLRSNPNYASDDSQNSRPNTPVATPTLATKVRIVQSRQSCFGVWAMVMFARGQWR